MISRTHTVSAFDEDLQKVQQLIMTMGGLVEESIGEAARALDQRDDELATRVVQNDKRIDALEEEVNNAVVRIIALRQPQASDLRLVVTVMKMAGNLERLGDFSKNLAKRVPILIQAQGVPGASASVRRLAKSVRLMLKDALDAYARGDAEAAAEVRARDVEVDQMSTALFREYLTHMMEDPRNITACMHLLFIAKNLERMGDHVTSIAEHVIFMATGHMPEEERPKGESTAYAVGPDFKAASGDAQ